MTDKAKRARNLMKAGYPGKVTKEELLSVQTPENVELFTNYVKNMVENGDLIPERDFRTGKDSGKRHLVMAGAQKIATAFNLSDDQEIINKTEEPPKKVHGNTKRKANGYWSYDVKSTLFHRYTNEMLDSCLGSCNSSEEGLENTTSNYVLKMAGKRAYIGAVIKAAKCSNLFDVDISTPDKNIKRIKSTSGTVNAPRFCGACKTNHIIKGMWLVESKDHNKYVAEICTKPNIRYNELIELSHSDILSRVISVEDDVFGNIKIPEHKAEIIKQRKISVSNRVLVLTKIESQMNKKENLVKYLLLLLDNAKNI